MKKYGENFSSPEAFCPYLPEQLSTYENFFALELSGEETDFILQAGWRKFGPHFFRPQCKSCQRCIPLRVPSEQFEMNKEQRRIWRKGALVKSHFHPLQYDPKLFELYQKHARAKFNSVPVDDEKDFLETFLIPATPALGHSLFLDGQLIASGFLDLGDKSLSSVYFFYDPDFARYSLGTLAILRELQYARDQKISYYYLGYYIAENQHMNYKARFSPHQLYDWYTKSWK